jgi:hypothetical protein
VYFRTTYKETYAQIIVPSRFYAWRTATDVFVYFQGTKEDAQWAANVRILEKWVKIKWEMQVHQVSHHVAVLPGLLCGI